MTETMGCRTCVAGARCTEHDAAGDASHCGVRTQGFFTFMLLLSCLPLVLAVVSLLFFDLAVDRR